METFKFKDPEDVYISVYKWIPETKVKAVLQIVHGMAEHAKRYDAFAKYLNERGIAVYAHDHRGHGESVTDNDFGYYGEGGFDLAVENTYTVTRMLKEDFPDVPNYILGHSMGSFVTQRFIQKHGDSVKKCILCGSNGPDFWLSLTGRIAAKTVSFIKGPKHYSKILNKLAFGSYNNRNENRTNSDWLSRDEAEVDKFINDPLCGKPVTADFFYELSKAIHDNFDKDELLRIPKRLPIFLIAGDMDPVGKYGKGVEKLYDVYKNIEIRDVQIKIYKGARHELLNEINKDEVMQDIYEFLDK